MKKEEEKLISEVVEFILEHPEGVVITHQDIKRAGGITAPRYRDYKNEEEFIQALQESEFLYLTFVERVRDTLLSEYNACLKNEKGVGYYILNPIEQINYGIDRTKKAVKKKISQGQKIIKHVEWKKVSIHDRKRANDNVAAWCLANEMLKGKL